MSYDIAHAGGTGKYLIDWIKNGEASFELFECDILRCGNWASEQYSYAKIRETYGMNNSLVYPKQERYAGRSIRTNSLYNIFKQKYGLVLGFLVWDNHHNLIHHLQKIVMIVKMKMKTMV